MDATAFILFFARKKWLLKIQSVAWEQVLPDGLSAFYYPVLCSLSARQNGAGIAGAFPALAGSKIINEDNRGDTYQNHLTRI